MLQERKTRRREVQLHDDDPPPRHIWRDIDPEDDEPDPFVALGHLVKGASKGLWRMVSRKDLKASKTQAEDDQHEAVEQQNEVVSDKFVIEMARKHGDNRKQEDVNAQIRTTMVSSHGDEIEQGTNTTTTIVTLQETQTSTPLATPVH
jgi:hypothetical protein